MVRLEEAAEGRGLRMCGKMPTDLPFGHSEEYKGDDSGSASRITLHIAAAKWKEEQGRFDPGYLQMRPSGGCRSEVRYARRVPTGQSKRCDLLTRHAGIVTGPRRCLSCSFFARKPGELPRTRSAKVADLTTVLRVVTLWDWIIELAGTRSTEKFFCRWCMATHGFQMHYYT